MDLAGVSTEVNHEETMQSQASPYKCIKTRRSQHEVS